MWWLLVQNGLLIKSNTLEMQFLTSEIPIWRVTNLKKINRQYPQLIFTLSMYWSEQTRTEEPQIPSSQTIPAFDFSCFWATRNDFQQFSLRPISMAIHHFNATHDCPPHPPHTHTPHRRCCNLRCDIVEHCIWQSRQFSFHSHDGYRLIRWRLLWAPSNCCVFVIAQLLHESLHIVFARCHFFRAGMIWWKNVSKYLTNLTKFVYQDMQV